MKLKVDKENDSLYLRLDDSKIIESEEVQKGVVLDYNESGQVTGIELLNISQRTDNINYNSLLVEIVQL